MKSIRRILFAVRNPESPHQAGFTKAVQVARAFGAKLELFHAIDDPMFVEFGLREDPTVDELRERIEEDARIPLARMCARAGKHGVQADCSVEWDYPPHE